MKGRKLIALIIVGMTCCGFSFEFELIIMPFVYLSAALVAWFFRRQAKSPSHLETAVLFVAVPGSYMVSKLFDWGPHPLIFVANSLCLFQLFRLFYPMNAVQKRYAITVATLHLAVATFVIVDWKFVIVLLLSLYLIPGAMMEVEAAKYKELPGITVRSGNWRYVVGTVVLMVIFFVAFPRIRRARYMNPGSMLGAVQPPRDIDMTETAGEGSDIKIMQVEGENLGYMKSFAMDVFDGTTWKVGLWGRKIDVSRLRARKLASSLPRTVKVLNYRALDERLPTDGFVVHADLQSWGRIYIPENGGLKQNHKPRGNFTYRYWTHLSEPTLWELDPRVRREYVNLGGFTPSERLVTWLEGVVGGSEDPETVAKRLESHFQVEFSYELGVPSLNRLAPMEDFIFSQRRGHCERYASALALLLRMKDIPSRVVIGYVPRELNEIGGFYTIRDNNRHAWVEAWIPGKGWVIYDATPAGADRSLIKRNIAISLAEWIEFTWYSKVVEFDEYKQNDVKQGISQVAGRIAFLIKSFWPAIGVLIVGLIGLYIIVITWRWWRRCKAGKGDHAESVRQARLFYGRLLASLEKEGLHLTVGQTPNEFLSHLEAVGHPKIESIRAITDLFCDIYYGEQPFSRDAEQTVESAFRDISS